MNPLNNGDQPFSSAEEFEQLVNLYYRDLYRFGLSLTKSEADAADLTQQTFYIWASKGHQLRQSSSVKGWLLTTLHREFLQLRRSQQRFSEDSAEEVMEKASLNGAVLVSRHDLARMLDCLNMISEIYKGPLVLYYLEDFAYKEIADILELPLGTVQSRIARGKSQLLQLLDGTQAERKEEQYCG
ncbi:MAG TPA: RNA polymerase sigma factor [Chthoniobacterales bacterium]|jgi:RNA polymerase sigma-70 factor (ECF subfamily)